MIALTAAIVGATLIVLGVLVRSALTIATGAHLEGLRIQAEDEAAQEALKVANEALDAAKVAKGTADKVEDEVRRAGLGRLGGKR